MNPLAQLFYGLTLFLLLSGCQPDTETDSKVTAQIKACTKELKICPEGQTVGRNPKLDCDFNTCPPPPAEDKCQGDMKQCPDGSFVIRDKANNCQFRSCPTATGKKPATVYCPQDVRQCPDGSYVDRDSRQNCAFNLCPNGKPPSENPLKQVD